MQWKVPAKYARNVTVNYEQLEIFQDRVRGYTVEYLKSVVEKGEQYKFCDERMMTYYWAASPNQTLKTKYLEFCYKVSKVDNFIYLNNLQVFNWNCMLNIIMSCKSGLTVLYFYLLNGTLTYSLVQFYDLILIIAQLFMIH